jgi:Mg-chelatase subunit ChlD
MFGRKKDRGGSSRGPARTVKLEVDPNGAPAVNLTKVRDAGHVDLVKRAEKAGLALSRNGLGGIRAELVAVLDYSGSMHNAYHSGQVQTITERALGLGLQIDRDGQVPLVTFGTAAKVAATATVDNYQGIVAREVMRDRMGVTNLTAALEIVLEMARATESPLFTFIVTDGRPTNRRGDPDEKAAERALVELSHYPVFVKILATTTVAKGWLEDLDDNLGGVLVDNIDTKFILDPDWLSDLQFAEAMADEWAGWIEAATAAGVLK